MVLVVGFQQLHITFCLSFQKSPFRNKESTAAAACNSIRDEYWKRTSLCAIPLHVVVRQQSNLTFVKVEHPTLKAHGSHAESLNLLRDIPFKVADDRLHLGRMVW